MLGEQVSVLPTSSLRRQCSRPQTFLKLSLLAFVSPLPNRRSEDTGINIGIQCLEDLLVDQPGRQMLRSTPVKLKRWDIKKKIIVDQSSPYSWQVSAIVPVLKPNGKREKRTQSFDGQPLELHS